MILLIGISSVRFLKPLDSLINGLISYLKSSLLLKSLFLFINGTPEGFFEISRGIIQGDPLSTFLYIIMVESFGRATKKAYNNKEMKGVTVTKNIPNITHQQYANDTILPGQSSQKEAVNVKSIIEKYMKASRQKVNEAKSEIFFINMETLVEDQIC